MKGNLQTINQLVAEKEAAMLDSCYQLLRHNMATKSLLLAKTQLANAGQNRVMIKENKDALAPPLELRSNQPHGYSATTIEACSDVVGLRAEVGDFTCYVNDRLNANEKFPETDSRAAHS